MKSYKLIETSDPRIAEKLLSEGWQLVSVTVFPGALNGRADRYAFDAKIRYYLTKAEPNFFISLLRKIFH